MQLSKKVVVIKVSWRAWNYTVLSLSSRSTNSQRTFNTDSLNLKSHHKGDLKVLSKANCELLKVIIKSRKLVKVITNYLWFLMILTNCEFNKEKIIFTYTTDELFKCLRVMSVKYWFSHNFRKYNMLFSRRWVHMSFETKFVGIWKGSELPYAKQMYSRKKDRFLSFF